MPLTKSIGNMYPWVDFMHTHLGGECSHKCIYCYVNNKRFGRAPRYAGPLRIIEEEFKVKYNKPGTYFIEHKNDLFAKDVPYEFVNRILNHCIEYQGIGNTYVFQTKNPERFLKWERIFPEKSILGCTVESNRDGIGNLRISHAPKQSERIFAFKKITTLRKFITIEPILDFDVLILANMVLLAGVEFVNIGADSKQNNLPEPSPEKIRELIKILTSEKMEIRGKENLKRLLQK
jgi:DNA repair photolyase